MHKRKFLQYLTPSQNIYILFLLLFHSFAGANVNYVKIHSVIFVVVCVFAIHLGKRKRRIVWEVFRSRSFIYSERNNDKIFELV